MASKLTSGYVLRSPKVAPTNSPNSATPTNGVVRDVKAIPNTFDFDLPGEVVDVSGDQYHAAVLNGPNQTPVEYLVWAANNSNLALLNDNSWSITLGTGTIPTGSVSVLDTASLDGQRADGSTRLIVADNSWRSLARIVSVKVIRGDDGTRTEHTFVYPTDYSVLDAESGVLYLEDNATTQALNPAPGNPPAFSVLRGDLITEVSYVVATSKFWWTRNDVYQTRFAWKGRTQRWEPLRGGTPSNLGVLAAGETSQLVPAPSGLVEGAYLAGDLTADGYATVRLGASPDASSIPIAPNPGGPYQGVLVVSDDSAATLFDFSVPPMPPAAVVGVTSGLVQWNQNFVALHAGATVWYVYESFDPEATGRLGLLLDAQSTPLHLAPVPGPTENPLLRLGSRRYLSVLFEDTEADQDAVVSVTEGTVVLARSTGRLRFSPADLVKADPTDLDFDIRFLDVEVFYDGVTLNQSPQPLRAAQAVVGSGGVAEVTAATNSLYVLSAEPLPGLGISGVLHLPDGTGATPTIGDAHLRPGGDEVVGGYSGLLRELEGVGDTILFTKSGALAQVLVVDTPSDFPSFRFQIPQGTGYISRALEAGPAGSLVELGATDRQAFAGEQLYFLQAELTPAQYTSRARVISRVRNTFDLDGTETLYFALDGTTVAKVVAPSGLGTYTAEEIATHLNTGLGTGRVYASHGHVVLEAQDPASGTVEIGFGSAVRDISGASALGLLPGWRVDTADPTTFWLPDSGVSVGMYRSPTNLDRSESIPDTQARARFSDELLVPSVTQQPYVFLTNPPLRDIAGWDEDVFFKLVSGDGSRQLQDLLDVGYQFTLDQPKFAWLEGHSFQASVNRPVSSLNLQRTNVLAASLVAPGGGLYVSESGGALVKQELSEDFLLEGSTGSATLISKFGSLALAGYRGSFVAGTVFTDLSATFISSGVQSGYQIKLTSGDYTGQSYIVSAVPTETTLVVSPAFPGTDSPVSWQVFEGYAASVYDPGLLADVVYEQFNHLQTEPFQIHVLSSVGVVGTPPNIAYPSDALDRGRAISVRFGLSGPESPLVLLQSVDVGTLANGLIVPEALSDRFTDEAFSIWLGGTEFLHGGSLLPVAAFTVPLAAGTIEYLTTTGALAFAGDLLTSYPGALVRYTQKFQSPVFVSGLVELDPLTGGLNFGSADLAAYTGETGYFVERMITEGRSDVSVNPVAGSFFFFQPLREGQIVEVAYSVADNTGALALDEEGNPITVTEFLPLFIRSEVATRSTNQVYTFNPSGKTGDVRIEPSVYIDVDRQNYGSKTTAVVSFDLSEIAFQGKVVDVSSTVTISYAVFEAFGGETSYSTSQRPVYRPPFFLNAGQSQFILEGNRTADMLPGKILRLGARPLYIRSAVLQTGNTVVTIYPPLDAEVGIRAPGNDVLSLLTSVPVTTNVAGTVTAAEAGFMLTLTSAYEPVRKGTREIRFAGDITRFAVPGHILEIGGTPFLVVHATQSQETGTTLVEVSVAFPQEYQFGTHAVKISVRPIYPSGSLQFLGLSPLIFSEPFELVLFSGSDPGRTLEVGLEYQIDAASGAVAFVDGVQEGLQAGQKLYLRYTKSRVLHPTVSNGYVAMPRIQASFHHVTSPSADNRLLGATVRGTYTVHSPDSFFFLVDTMESFLTEVQQDRVEALASQSPSGGPIVTTPPLVANQDRGSLGFDAKRRALLDRDRAGRTLLDFYNSTVTALEQVKETSDGYLVGDWDGKFRHFVGRGARFAPPGYEDSITGYLNPRYVWSEVFLAETSDRAVPLRTLPTDPLVKPSTASLANAELTGNLPTPNTLAHLSSLQSMLLRNDVDDLLLTQRGALQVTFTGFPPRRVYQAQGIYRSMAEPHQFSRLFPTQATAFTTTVPGLGADPAISSAGVYAYRRTISVDGVTETASTFREPVATLSNPVLGTFTNITDSSISIRYPRARVVSFSAIGYADVDIASSGVPSALLSVVPLAEFPVDTGTGLPDLTRLRSQDPSGFIADLSTGNTALHTPPFEAGQQLYLGRASGTVLPLRSAREKITIQGVDYFGGVYVASVLSGCIVTFTGTTLAVTDASQLITVDENGLPTAVSMGVGDTLFVLPNTATDVISADPPTQADIQRLASAGASYRNGFDLRVDSQTGEVLDLTQSSFADPSNLAIKEILGQNPLSPQLPIEAQVSFANASTQHLEIPALQGQALNDSGDEGIPYKSATSEQDLLREASYALMVMQEDTLIPSPVYPQEILGNDGAVVTSPTVSLGVAALASAVDVRPRATAGFYTAHSGVANTAQGDILLVQVDDTASSIAVGSQGILSVGQAYRIGGVSYVQPSRFITQTRAGDRVRYVLENAMVHVAPVLGASGVTVEEVGAADTVFTFTGVSFFLDDGNGTSQGGLNNILDNALLAFPNENHIRLHLIDQTSGLLLETVEFSGDPLPTFAALPTSSATGGLGTVYDNFGNPVTIGNGVISFGRVGFVDFAALGGAAPGPVGPFDVAITVDTYTAGFSGTRTYTGSATANIEADRLTFVEKFDLSATQVRGTVTVGAYSLEASLEVETVTSPDSEELTVNHSAETNGGVPFTFLERTPGSIGTFTPASVGGAGDEGSWISVMGWEGAGNTPIVSTAGMQFATLPSSAQDTTGVICQGEGSCNGGVAQYDFRVSEVDVTAGALSKVLPGDILVIDRAADPTIVAFPGAYATSVAGSYLVRQVVESDDPVTHPDRQELILTANAGEGTGWVDLSFPKVVGYDDALKELTVTGIQLVADSPTAHTFPATGRVYVLTNIVEISNAGDFAAFRTAVLSASYTGVTQATGVFTGLANFKDAGGVVIASAAFDAAVSAGMQVSGMLYYPIQVGGEQGLPASNVVGRHTASSVYGLRFFGVEGDIVPTSASAAIFYDGAAGEISDAAGGGVFLIVHQMTPEPSTSFVPDLDSPVYNNIPGVLDLTSVPSADWTALHKPVAHPTSLVECILPGESLVTEDVGNTPGFWAQAAVFLEPAWPRPTPNLSSASAHIVDANHSLAAPRLGMRDINDFLPAPPAPLALPERVTFAVRRVPRFSAQRLSDALYNMRYLYETRRGVVTGYSATRQMGIVQTNGTQLGALDSPLVNIHPGDTFRLLGSSGEVLEETSILGVRDATDLLVSPPGLTFPLLGTDFEILLRQPMVPLEQSHDQLLELIMDSVLVDTKANYTIGTGGYVTATNVLRDTNVAGGVTYSSLGVQVGDIVLIDPSGELSPPSAPLVPERGAAPEGDFGVSTRVDGSYLAGAPSELDDNRGFYRVLEVHADNLVLSGASDFAGDTTSGDVIFESGGPEFVLYPTVHASVLTGTVEGQNDLRLTSLAGENGSPAGSYQGNAYSVAPFSYQVFRPIGLLSDTSVDLLLALRERFQSWSEHLLYRGFGGTFFVFQRDAQAADLSAWSSASALGGQTEITPFANDSDALSVLDRRFWIGDLQLDYTSPPFAGGSPYTSFSTGVGRPVFPDHIELALGKRDNLRDFRSVWLGYRANLIDGTLASIRRYDAQEPQRQKDQQNLMRFRKGSG